MEMINKDFDIEKEANEDWNIIFGFGWDDNTLLTLTHKEFILFVKHYFELGINNSNKED